mgnify:CR=1 FL=1
MKRFHEILRRPTVPSPALCRPLWGRCRTRTTEGEFFLKPPKRLRFAHEGTSTLLERKMRPRPRLWFWPTQRPCFRVSSSCTLYEVFGNFAWRNAPPRKRVAQSEKALALRDRECPRPTGLSVDSLLRSNKGNGNGGNSVRKGENFTPPLAGLILFLFRDSSPRRQERPWPHFSIKQSA